PIVKATAVHSANYSTSPKMNNGTATANHTKSSDNFGETTPSPGLAQSDRHYTKHKCGRNRTSNICGCGTAARQAKPQLIWLCTTGNPFLQLTRPTRSNHIRSLWITTEHNGLLRDTTRPMPGLVLVPQAS